MALNAEGVPAPRSRTPQQPGTWTPSTIHGHARRGTGILNNELYVGRRIWNRQRYEKHPDTGRRLARLNPQDARVINEVSELRIVDDDVCAEHRSRASGRQTRAADHGRESSGYGRSLPFFSGLDASAPRAVEASSSRRNGG